MATTTNTAKPRSFKERFGAECKGEMKRQGLTYAEVAPRLRMTEDQLYRRLSGKSVFPIDEAANLAVLLRVGLDVLVRRAQS